jgi:hypothetical protein
MNAPTKVDPLNPVLYGLLERKFGEVRLAKAGVPAVFETLLDPIFGRRIQRAVEWGEYYAICCPFCNDVGHKLWINHQYGLEYDERTGRRTNTHLANCYKNECLQKQAGRYEQLEDIVFGAGKRLFKTMTIRHAEPDVRLREVEPPGAIMSLADLPDDHPAVTYLSSRRFDSPALTADFDVGLCTEAKSEQFRLMKDRLYIPVSFNKKLIGWQGRATNERRVPKYYNMPGMQKGHALYNYDRAAAMPAVIVVEGVPSVWRLGAAGVCIFGKSLSMWQCNTIATTWANKPIFFMLDSDAVDELEAGTTQLCRHSSSVVPVVLPDSRDPADYNRSDLRQLLQAAAAAVDVSADLSFLE